MHGEAMKIQQFLQTNAVPVTKLQNKPVKHNITFSFSLF